MNLNKVKTFGPGQGFRLDRKVIFVEYESMTGEFVRCRFDLSQKTEMILDNHRILSFDNLTYLYSKGEEIFIKKAEYYEKECHMVVGDKLLILTKVYFETAGYQQAYGTVSRDWADVLADSARYIYMSGARSGGKTMWLSNIAKSIEEDARNDVIERWLKNTPITPIKLSGIPEFISDDLEDCEKGVPNTKLIDPKLYFQDTTTGEMKPYEGIKSITPAYPNGYFDTDMAMTREEMMKATERYCLNDVAVTEKLFKEEKIMRFETCKPTIKNVIFNDPATIVMWSDGTKTVVKCGENDSFDPEKGIAMCCMKKLLGTNKTGSNYLDKVNGYLKEYNNDAISTRETISEIGEILSGIFGCASDSTDIPPEESIEKEFEAVTSNDWTVVPADENTTAEENGE